MTLTLDRRTFMAFLGLSRHQATATLPHLAVLCTPHDTLPDQLARAEQFLTYHETRGGSASYRQTADDLRRCPQPLPEFTPAYHHNVTALHEKLQHRRDISMVRTVQAIRRVHDLGERPFSDTEIHSLISDALIDQRSPTRSSPAAVELSLMRELPELRDLLHEAQVARSGIPGEVASLTNKQLISNAVLIVAEMAVRTRIARGDSPLLPDLRLLWDLQQRHGASDPDAPLIPLPRGVRELATQVDALGLTNRNPATFMPELLSQWEQVRQLSAQFDHARVAEQVPVWRQAVRQLQQAEQTTPSTGTPEHPAGMSPASPPEDIPASLVADAEVLLGESSAEVAELMTPVRMDTLDQTTASHEERAPGTGTQDVAALLESTTDVTEDIPGGVPEPVRSSAPNDDQNQALRSDVELLAQAATPSQDVVHSREVESGTGTELAVRARPQPITDSSAIGLEPASAEQEVPTPDLLAAVSTREAESIEPAEAVLEIEVPETRPSSEVQPQRSLYTVPEPAEPDGPDAALQSPGTPGDMVETETDNRVLPLPALLNAWNPLHLHGEREAPDQGALQEAALTPMPQQVIRPQEGTHPLVSADVRAQDDAGTLTTSTLLDVQTESPEEQDDREYFERQLASIREMEMRLAPLGSEDHAALEVLLPEVQFWSRGCAGRLRRIRADSARAFSPETLEQFQRTTRRAGELVTYIQGLLGDDTGQSLSDQG